MELFDSMLITADSWGVVFVMPVARVLMVIVAALTWHTVDNGDTIHTFPFLIITQDNASLSLAFSIGAPIS